MNDGDAGIGIAPPHSDEAEQSVLGSLLSDNACYEQVAPLLTAADFYSPDHRAIFASITDIIAASKPADAVTVQAHGGHDIAYLSALAVAVPSASNARRYAEVVRDRSLDRKLVRIGGDAIIAATDPKVAVELKVLAVQEALGAMTFGTTQQEPQLMDAMMPAHIDLIQSRADGGGLLYPTGLIDLDRKINGGMRPGQLLVIAARPSMGKTTLGMTIARHVAATGSLTLVLTMEMTAEQLNDATIAALGHVPLEVILQPKNASDEDWSRISAGVDRVKGLNLQVDDQAALTLVDVRRKCVQARRKAKGQRIGLIVVDYIQLMQHDGDNRAVQIGAIANGLKAIAKQQGCPIIALAQCNREADKKADGADAMSDINESGGIEAAADFVGLIHREYVRTEDPKLANYGQLRIAKNRIGTTGRVNLYFEGRYQFFGSWEGPAPDTGRGVVRATHSEKGMR